MPTLRKLVVLIAVPAFLTVTAALGDGTLVLSAPDAYDATRSGERLIIDIRRPDEWRETGIAQGALTVTMHRDGGPTAFLNAIDKSVDGRKDTPIALICASGSRSAWAQRFLAANGYSDVANIREGMLGRGSLPGWIERGLPTAPCPDC